MRYDARQSHSQSEIQLERHKKEKKFKEQWNSLELFQKWEIFNFYLKIPEAMEL